MEIVEFKKVLAKSLDVVNVGIRKGYFDTDKKEELNNKLITIFNNKIVYDIPGTAIYGMYTPNENKLYFNAKVFKNEEEALVYILHEIKHGLDCYGNTIGFDENDLGVGINEGATQRFATDIAEEILQIKFPVKVETSLGIQLNTNLDEYQIEDKLNYLFCLTMGISIEDFIKMQNDKDKQEFKKLITKFNQYANYEVFKKAIDDIYKIQEETWFDENGNIYEEEKKPTISQTKRTMDLINICKQELSKYARIMNPNVLNNLKKETFMTINETGEILRDNFMEDEINISTDIMSDENIVTQADYMDYQQKILKQIDYFDLKCHIVFITEFGYEKENADKIIYFRKGETYFKMIIPMQDNQKMDIDNKKVLKVNISEIKNSIMDCEAEFGVIANALEYAKILKLDGENAKAESIINKWNYFLSKQNNLEEIRHKVEKQRESFREDITRLRNSLLNEKETQQEFFDNFLKKEIQFENIILTEKGIMVINPDGTIRLVPKNLEEQYLLKIKKGVLNGALTLNKIQTNLLASYEETIKR